MNSPFTTYFGLSTRSSHCIEMYRPDELPITGYQFWGHRTIDGAYGDPPGSGVGGDGPDSMFEVTRGQQFRSPSVKRKGLGFFASNRRGQTTVFFDPEDYVTVGGNIGMDDEWLFLRVQEDRSGLDLLDYPNIPEATVTLAAVAATDQLIVKGVYFEFAAGANNLAGKAGTVGDPFIVGLGAGDNDAASNLTDALNDDGDVGPAMDALAPLDTRTYAENTGAPSAVVVIQPETDGGDLIPGSTAMFAISTPDAPRVGIDATALAAGTLVYSGDDSTNPVLGAIYCVPPPLIYGMEEPVMVIGGTVPIGTDCSDGAIPAFNDDLTDATPRPLYIVFPVPLSAITLLNTGASDLLFSFGPGMPMTTLASGAEMSLFSGRTKQIIMAADATTTFRLHGVLGLGA